MKLTFESDGSDADILRIAELTKRLSTGVHNYSTVERAVETPFGKIPDIEATPAPEKEKSRKLGKRLPKADPFELVKQGYVLRGPYVKGKGLPKALVMYHPDNSRHKIEYSLGTQITEAQIVKLKPLAAGNEKNVKTRGGQFKVTQPGPSVTAPNSRSCQICLQQKNNLGTCDKMKAVHCEACHNDIHSSMLDNFKPIPLPPIVV